MVNFRSSITLIRNGDEVETNEEIKTEDKKPSGKQELKREAIEFVKMVVWFLILFVAVRTYIVEGYEVQGTSMAPTLHDNERILVFKLPHVLSGLFGGIEGINDGDIVVFDSPPDEGSHKRFVKRVIAKGPNKRNGKVAGAQQHDTATFPSDMVSVKFAEGIVYVNNHPILENYINRDKNKDIHYSEDEVLLKPGEYYVMGDNRNVSKDSRRFGPIVDDNMIGTAVFRFWPPSKIGFLK